MLEPYELEAYENGEWKNVSKDYLKFPEDVDIKLWMKEFMILNGFVRVGVYGSSVDSIDVYRKKNMSVECEYPYFASFNLFQESRFILFPKWRDAAHFLNNYCLISMSRQID